ncbi:TetR/AcrR family transcriptional regulator [Nocardioides convexus]|uniref:TetR/AcrR family transcriptional regulator n=1 Tax=Nocardioides convexus TaxID=2712224 RepID=UPI002418A043|nr:TetR/AcrR family transcriptional regulator [Nocardioides convexus]
MAQIAARAEIGRTAIYHHFKDKEAVVVAFATEETQHYLADLRRDLDLVPDPVAKIRVYLRHQAPRRPAVPHRHGRDPLPPPLRGGDGEDPRPRRRGGGGAGADPRRGHRLRRLPGQRPQGRDVPAARRARDPSACRSRPWRSSSFAVSATWPRRPLRSFARSLDTAIPIY